MKGLSKKSFIWFWIGSLTIVLGVVLSGVESNLELNNAKDFVGTVFGSTVTIVNLFSLTANLLSIYFGVRSWLYEKKICEWIALSAFSAMVWIVVAGIAAARTMALFVMIITALVR
jgi:hypothetical protein